jgi:Flp pilus assembly pilin Flp
VAGRDERSGVSSVETGLILLLVAIAPFLAVSFLGGSLGDELGEVPGAFDSNVVTTTTSADPDGTSPGGGGGGGGDDPIEDPCEEDPDQPSCSTSTTAPGGG